MKRSRVEADPPASTDDGLEATGDELHGDLAAWCDKELREAAAIHIDNIPSATCENSEMNSFGDDSFEEFLESMRQDQSVTVSEHRKGAVAEAWRRAVADATRLQTLVSMFTETQYSNRFNNVVPARGALKAIAEASTEAVDEWYFNLGYDLAKEVLAAGGKRSDSDEESDSEPASDDDSEDEGEESESESGSVSESGSESH